MVVSRGLTNREEQQSSNRVVANRYKLVNKLGHGQYGTVFLVEDGQSVYNEEKFKVLKEIPVGEMPPDETIDAMREAKLQAKLDHIGVVKCFNNFLDGDFFCIISEYCDGGDLDKIITKAKQGGSQLSETQILDYFCQIVLSTRYMHQKQILHRDLKPRNIFLKDNTCKLGDFGISRVLMGTADMASTFIGTPYYMSPEVLKHEGYDAKSDMWSIGVILYEMCTLEHCFDGQSMMAVLYKITQGKIPKLPERFSPDLQKIYEGLVHRNQKTRLNSAQVLKDPFISAHLQKMKKRVPLQWVHAVDIATNILEQEVPETTAAVNNNKSINGPQMQQDALEVPLSLLQNVGIDEAGVDDGGAVDAEKTVMNVATEETLAAAQIKTAAELAAERKRLKQLEEENLIRAATKNTWLENYKHRDNVKRLYHGQDAEASLKMQPGAHHTARQSSYPGPTEDNTEPQRRRISQPASSGADPQLSSSVYNAPVVPKPTRISSPDSPAPRRVATTHGENKPNLKASLSSSPEDQERSKRSDPEEDSGFSSVNASGDSSGQFEMWNNRPITAKNKHFEEILEEELRKSSDVSSPYTPPKVIPKKPFVPLKKGSGKMAYNSNAQKLQKRRRARKKRGVNGDEVDGGIEYDYEDDFEDYVESEPEQYDEDYEGNSDEAAGEDEDPGSRNKPENRPITFVDAYSPTVKVKKIQNMRSQCISKMGERKFTKVYNYLQTARKKRLNESQIFKELDKLQAMTDDAFLVDQLIFLESDM